jgi:hypothetical protein
MGLLKCANGANVQNCETCVLIFFAGVSLSVRNPLKWLATRLECAKCHQVERSVAPNLKGSITMGGQVWSSADPSLDECTKLGCTCNIWVRNLLQPGPAPF